MSPRLASVVGCCFAEFRLLRAPSCYSQRVVRFCVAVKKQFVHICCFFVATRAREPSTFTCFSFCIFDSLVPGCRCQPFARSQLQIWTANDRNSKLHFAPPTAGDLIFGCLLDGLASGPGPAWAQARLERGRCPGPGPAQARARLRPRPRGPRPSLGRGPRQPHKAALAQGGLARVQRMGEWVVVGVVAVAVSVRSGGLAAR